MSARDEDGTLLETAPADQATPERRRGPRPVVLLPLVLFFALAGVFLYQLLSGHDPKEIPSVLVGKSAPMTVLPALAGATLPNGQPVPGLDLSGPGDGRPVLVNVFASWCAPCRDEHPLLMQLAKDERFRLVAINYKDKPDNALGFLQNLGNPYAAIGVDQKGAATIDWGVYGVPETFLVAPDGEILYKQTGPFTPEAIRTGLMPAVERALQREPKARTPTS
ncbi:DsbE family thiol:disulfide interchange protein [Aurantimonas sp. 22II-16-19i]|uniref:DsbE family thiol:disulfide interchange protein n=1 Tax=Aurantimonas sp. 22II-16-19i TaxID=1317114 RepID=UPI0009F7A552|nr:DsbE family thiol:disulfide interchange protein [Aurantimonas sp. 22II-16-19i]ORE93863.1 periplasmic protein thiol:disulfide oxidoreductase, DsbE subfamily protein [Aurantimonas sp. 22II-16-19i]